MATVTACSDDGGTGPGSASSVNQFLGTLPSWGEFSPPVPDNDDIVSPSAESIESVDGTLYACTSAPYSITRTPDKVVTMDPDVNILWLGALLQGRGYKEGIGSLAEWSVKERAPLRVSVDLLNGQNAAIVEDPDLTSVTRAVGTMIQAAEAGGHKPGSSISYSMQRTYSARQAGISMGLSTMYFGPTISASFSASRNAKETTVTAYFVQRMFTASMALPNAGADFFSSEFTPARLQQERDRGHVGSDNIPVYVASIVYGRSLLFSFTSTSTADSIRAALSASIGKDSAGINGSYLNILRSARIGVVALGGEARNATALIQSGELADYFKEPASLTSARPISYTIRNLGDNSIAKVSETSEYNLKECEAIPTTGRATIDVTPNDASVSVLGPGGYSFGPKTGDQLLTELVPGGYVITVARAGFDTATADISIAAGDALDVPITLQATDQTPTGTIYSIIPRRLYADAVGCTGESEADLFHSIAVNGKTLTNRPQDASLPLFAGQFDERAKGPGYWSTGARDTVWTTGSRTKLSFTMLVEDDDGGLNAPDPMANTSWALTSPNIPVALGKERIVSYAGCTVRFVYDIVKEADIFSPAPALRP